MSQTQTIQMLLFVGSAVWLAWVGYSLKWMWEHYPPREVLNKYSRRTRQLASVPLPFLNRQAKIEPQDRQYFEVYRKGVWPRFLICVLGAVLIRFCLFLFRYFWS